jgi:RHS repeat-associated protein
VNAALQTALPEHLPLAALPQLAENSRLGFQSVASTSQWGSSFSISSSTLSLSASLSDGRVGSRCRATYRYAGYRYDNETGLYYVNARYYNPNLGRFLQTDPIGLQGGTNLYAYVGDDPINLFDPMGLCSQTTQSASNLRLAPVTDTTPGSGIAVRDILYQVQNADGSSYVVDSTHPTQYVSEIITVTSGSAPAGTVPTGNGTYTSSDPQGDSFADGLGNKNGISNASFLQSFIVSTTPGVNPACSAPIIVQYGGQDYGTIAVNINVMPPSVTTNGLKVYPMSP